MAKPKTFSVMVGSESFLVVLVKPSFWISRDVENRHHAHLGKLLEAPIAVKVLDKPKPCSHCKGSSWAATPRGRAVHDGCEGWLDTLPDPVFAQVVFEAAVAAAEVDESSDPISAAVPLLVQQLGARTARTVSLSLPASRVSARTIAGLRKAARAHPGPFQLKLRLFNAGQLVELPLPMLVSEAIEGRLKSTFGPNTVLVRSNS